MARKLLEFPEALERDNYTQAVAREQFIPYQDLKQLVSRLSSRIVPGAEQTQPREEFTPRERKKEKEDGTRQSQRLLLTWLIEDPKLFDKIEGIITPDEDYQYLKEAVNKLTEKQKSQISIMNVINYVTGLKSFIKKDSLVEMRRHEHPERYLESFQDCRKKAEAIMNQEPEEMPLPTGQLSLFDLFGLTMGG